jgi:superfamily II DNA or RNA helicase/HKD family nuclease
MAIIDNQTQTMLEALKNALSTSDKVDVQVGYFYFSGFELLAGELKNKKVRILVGKQIDPNTVPKIVSMQQKTGKPVDFDRFQPHDAYSSRSVRKADYFDGFTRLFNETSVFDEPRSQDAYKIFEQKIIDGSLEIKLTNTEEHGKMYLIHNNSQNNQGGDFPGTLFIGSSNLTYNGLLDQGELNTVSRDKLQFLEGLQKFESMWLESENIDIATKENQSEFKDVIRKLWINAVEQPYLMYIRVLHELFGQDKETEIKTPSKITGESFIDLEYQLDAIKMGINKIEQYGGVIIADVVGLGKSIIASTIAYNIAQRDNINVIIISPPHLKSQWEDYQANFHLPGTKIFSSGKIDDAYNWCFNDQTGPAIIVIDEAHRYRNELTDDYMLLHQLVRSNKDNKVVVLTATPFNNDPKDVFALVKLFQTPGQSTIKSVDNLSIRFRELIQRYKELRNAMRGSKLTEGEIEVEAKDISRELKRLIEPIIIRRSRLDLRRISRYRNNLIKQGIEFAEIDCPTLLEYDLGDLFDLYITTLEKITDEENGFIGARYKPATYMIEEHKDKIKEKYGQQIDDSDLVTAQTNLAKFMKRLLVMRFESSKQAFGITLQNMIDSNLFISKWYHEKGQIPVLKKGRIPDPDSYEIDTEDNITEELTEQLEDESRSKHRLIFVDRNWINHSFIQEVEADIELLQKIKSDWFEDSKVKNFDPKLDNLSGKIKELLSDNPDKKIIIFSAYADTVDYVSKQLKERGFSRTFKYTAADASRSYREELKQNFDAGIKEELQKNDYDILVATDALSEGYNLHRAGIIFNYDIPFNPTRVIQRIGRINRINKKVFDRLHIFNFFPTSIG